MHTSRRLAGHDELNLIQFSGHSGLGLIVRMILLATLTTCCDICELCYYVVVPVPAFLPAL